MKRQDEKIKYKKQSLFTMALALALFLTGTFAWSSISQRATNELEMLGLTHGGRVHDDFDSENKDVYAENFGTSELYVRIKLTEYMEIDGTALVSGTSKTDKTTWIPNVLGIDSVFSGYVEWTLGGKKTYMPTFNTDKESLETDVTGIAIDDESGTTNPNPDLGDGTHNYWTLGEQYTDPVSNVTNIAKDTLSPELGGYMTMTEWLNNNKPTGNFWVIDIDGWAYWANALAPKEATSLLLDSITMVHEPSTEWYYAINVIGEFATANDIDNFIDMSPNAKQLMYSISGNEQYKIVIMQEENSAIKGTTHQLTAQVTENETVLSDTDITWTIVSAHVSGTSVDTNGLVTIDNEETNTSLVVRASYQGVFSDITFSITAP
ncbi:MAG: hypothetical protein ACK5LC_18330 [Coprobacillaceae bacterium]